MLKFFYVRGTTFEGNEHICAFLQTEIPGNEDLQENIDKMKAIFSSYRVHVESIEETEVCITGHYYRDKDDTSFISYLDKNNHKHLTNGVMDWTRKVDDKIATLNADNDKCDVNKILSYMRNSMTHTEIYRFLSVHPEITG